MNNLLKILKDHGITAYSVNDENLKVLEEGTQYDLKTGEEIGEFSHFIELEPTEKAVYHWLGY